MKLKLVATGKLSNKTIGEGYIAAVKTFFSWAKETRIVKANPCDGIRIKRDKVVEDGPSEGRDIEPDQRTLIMSESLREVDPRMSPWTAAARRCGGAGMCTGRAAHARQASGCRRLEPKAPAWPPSRAVVEAGLDRVDDADLRRRIRRLARRLRRHRNRERERALVHSDLGFHNVAFDAATGAINDVFDYGDAAWADRHLDFRCLVFASVPDAMLDAVVVAYRDATGIFLDRHHDRHDRKPASVSRR